jgi:hypothetical protein
MVLLKYKMASLLVAMFCYVFCRVQGMDAMLALHRNGWGMTRTRLSMLSRGLLSSGLSALLTSCSWFSVSKMGVPTCLKKDFFSDW